MRLLVIAAIAGLLAASRSASAQKAQALTGRVVDRSTGNGLVHAQIILTSDSRSVFTDSTGRFVFSDLPMGVSKLVIKAAQFPDVTLYIDLAQGQQLERPIPMDSTSERGDAQALAAVSVSADAPVQNYRLSSFERRRHSGHGQFRDEDELLRSGAYTLQDVVLPMRGVDVDCSKTTPMGDGCKIHMSRAPTNCSPQFIVDDHVDEWFGPRTPIRDIIAVEVYTGPADLPGEFASSNAACGVIVIWTKSGPTRRTTRKP